MPAAIALADVSKSVSAVSFGDLDLDANHEGDDVSLTPPENDASGYRAGGRLEERLRCCLRRSGLGHELIMTTFYPTTFYMTTFDLTTDFLSRFVLWRNH